MEPTDHLLVLAHGVITISDALEQLEEAESIGVPVGYSLIGTLRGKQRSLASQWWTTTHNEPVWRDQYLDPAVEEARAWTTTHWVRLSELKEQE